MIVGTGLVIAVALLISRPVAVFIGLALAGFVTYLAIRGIIDMLRPPPEDEGEAVNGGIDRESGGPSGS